MLDRFGVELIGAKIDAIKKAEDRDLFKAAMQRIGLSVPRSGIAHTMDDAHGAQGTRSGCRSSSARRAPSAAPAASIAATDEEYDRYRRRRPGARRRSARSSSRSRSPAGRNSSSR